MAQSQWIFVSSSDLGVDLSIEAGGGFLPWLSVSGQTQSQGTAAAYTLPSPHTPWWQLVGLGHSPAPVDTGALWLH